jgi:uncharacterized protein involved in exopolysaccharide biosynthesis
LNEAIAREGAAYIDSVYRVYEINLLDAPRIPDRPVSPDPIRNAMVAGALGAGLGLGLAILRRPQPVRVAEKARMASVSGHD